MLYAQILKAEIGKITIGNLKLRHFQDRSFVYEWTVLAVLLIAFYLRDYQQKL